MESLLELRTVQVSGGQTRIISLPKDWAVQHHLDQGSKLYLKELPNGDLIIQPLEKIKKAAEINDSRFLQRDLISRYLSGYEIIKIKGKDPNTLLKDKEKIREISRNLVGLEILEESLSHIELHFLIDSSTLHPQKYLSRTFSIARSMQEDALRALLENDSEFAREVQNRDNEVNRLYFLLIRLLKTMVDDPSTENAIPPSECLDWRIVAGFAEEIGDLSVEISQEAEKIEAERITEESKRFLIQINQRILESMDLALNAFLNHNVVVADQIKATMQRDLEPEIRELSKKIPEVKGWEFAILTRLFQRTVDIVIDITDLVIETGI